MKFWRQCSSRTLNESRWDLRPITIHVSDIPRIRPVRDPKLALPLNQITHILNRAQRSELLPFPTFVVVRRQRSDPPVKAHVSAERCSPFQTGDLVSRITRECDTRAFTQKLVATRSLR